jgi:glycosyltransferase involved in cell wall biosynthesis
VRKNLEPLMGVLERLNRTHPIELIVVGLRAPSSDTVPVRHLPWEADTYYEHLRTSDLGLFPFFEEEREENWARVAGKTLDYMASALPFVGVTEGLAEGIDLERHLCAIVENDEDEWLEKLTAVLSDEDWRAASGRAARAFIEEYRPVDVMYRRLRDILAS